MISIQASGCAPIIKALHEEKPYRRCGQTPNTLAAGLRVPKAYGDFIILDIIRQSGGTAVAVTDDEIMAGSEGNGRDGRHLRLRPKAVPHWLRIRSCSKDGFLKESDKVVLFNTGSGYKYLDTFANYWGLRRFAPPVKLPASRNIGGIIGPY